MIHEKHLSILNKLAVNGAEIHYDREPATVFYQNEVGGDEDELIINELTQAGLAGEWYNSLVSLFLLTDKGAALLARS